MKIFITGKHQQIFSIVDAGRAAFLSSFSQGRPSHHKTFALILRWFRIKKKLFLPNNVKLWNSALFLWPGS
jgi:hypothetical protein